MGLSSSTRCRKKSKSAIDKGPFGDEEFEVLCYNFRLFSEASNINTAWLTKEQFQSFIPLGQYKSFGANLYKHFTCNSTKTLDFKSFLVEVEKCVRSSPRQTLQVLFYVCSGGRDTLTEEEVVQLFLLTYALCCGIAEVDTNFSISKTEGFAEMLLKRSKPVMDGDPKVLHVKDLLGWAEQYAPLFHLPLSAYLEKVLLTPATAKGSVSAPANLVRTRRQLGFAPPRLSHPSPLLGQQLMPQIALLATHTAKLQGTWVKLYDAREDGISFNRVVHKTLGYGGPTLVLIRDTGGAVFGGLAPSRWRANNSMYGEGEGFLFRLLPDFRIYPSRVGGNGNFMYLNLKGFSLPHGMGMGGDIGSFRLFLPESLEQCSSLSRCLTFENGELASTGKQGRFEIQDLEIWGCGGSDKEVQKAMGKQAEVRQATAETIQKARKVDKAAFLDNAFDKEFLLGKTFNSGARAVADDVREDS